MRLHELQVKAARHKCGSFSIIVCSSTLSIKDDRAGSRTDCCDEVVSIGQDLPQTSSGLRHVDSLHVRHHPQNSVKGVQQVSWSIIALHCRFASSGVDGSTDWLNVSSPVQGPEFNPPHALGRLSSLKWEPLGTAPEGSYSLASWRHTADSAATDMRAAADKLVSCNTSRSHLEERCPKAWYCPC